MRAWITVMLLPLALEALRGCVFLLWDTNPRPCHRVADVARIPAVVGLLGSGVLALRSG